MRQRSRFFVANIVLGIIFAIFFFISLTVTIVINETLGDVEGIYGDLSEEYLYDDYSYENDVYSLLSIENADAQLIGEEYLGETAYEGYQYYRVEYQIHNAGTIYETLGYLDLDCQGEEDEDAYQEYYFDDSDND